MQRECWLHASEVMIVLLHTRTDATIETELFIYLFILVEHKEQFTATNM
jgi:hypothetical protein